MNLEKLAPWNWFEKEEKEQGSTPVKGGNDTFGLSELHKEFDRLFHSMQRNFGFSRDLELPGGGFFKPSLDIASDGEHYTVKVELPGVSSKDIDVEIEDELLRIKGEKKQESEEKKKGYYKMERSYGSFERVLNLPEDCDKESVASEFKDGVLTVTMKRKPLTKNNVKKVEIKHK